MRRILLAAAAACLTTGVVAPSVAQSQSRDLQPRPYYAESDGKPSAAAAISGRSSFSHLEDPPSDPSGLPAARENIDLVGELNPQRFGGVRIGEIADLAVHKGYAYLNSWDNTECDRGGVYVVDIRDPAAPKEVTYIPPMEGSNFYHGEGAHAISVDVPGFKGDILAVNNETFGSNTPAPCSAGFDESAGGFDIYDVSDPANPKTVVQGAGDRDGGDGPLDEQETATANSYHSVFVWQSGARVYAVGTDNVEFEDVDVFDITDTLANPAVRPTQVLDLDIFTEFPEVDDDRSNGGAIFNHDMIVKQIDGRQIMSVSYWDAGYVQIDVTDPGDPKLVTQTTVGNDSFRPNLVAEGNAHYSEFSADNQFLLGADEDFAPFRSVLTGGTGRSRSAIEGGDNPVRIANLPDREMDGPSTWVGNACTLGSVAPAPADDGDPETDAIALVERGGCSFADKFDNAAAAGYDGIVIFNQEGIQDSQVNMLTVDGDGPPTIPGVHMRRADALGPEGALTNDTTAPAPGTPGPNVRVGVVFDGWGYAHLFDAKTSELIDSWAVAESQDPRFASDFGDLSIHEMATDPSEPVAYAAYYGAGMRVVRFSRENGIVESGKFIDDDGNGSNFWGVEVFTGSDGERYFAGSDRDFGLQIFRYTGPGAAQKPVCTDSTATTQFRTPVTVDLTCTDANGNPLSFSIVDQPDNGTLSAVSNGKVTYTPNNRFSGNDTFTFKANDGTADSNTATMTIKVLSRAESPNYNQKRKPRITAKARPRRDTTKPFIFRVQGRLLRPKGISKADACKGTVRIIAKKRGKTVAKRRTGIKSTCKYKARVKLRKSAGKRGKVKFHVKFLGNDRLLTASARTSAKFGKKRR